MKERGILFSADMVRAILDDRKTQTRRVLTKQPTSEPMPREEWGVEQRILGRRPAPAWLFPFRAPAAGRSAYAFTCPFGQPGDQLWVRETWYDDLYLAREAGNHGDRDSLYYRADGECCDQIAECCCKEVGPVRWRPSIFMPRWASRITLEITDVRVERVQAVTKNDCVAEGLKIPCNEQHRPLLQLSGKYPACQYPPFNSRATIESATLDDYFRAYYASLWDALNAKRGYGWDANPWVWVIEFKRVEEQQAVAA